MTIHNISITIPNTTTLYPVKAPVLAEPTYDYIQCPPSEAEGIAVLRYAPAVAEVVVGEFYANGTALKSYNKCTVQCTVVNVQLVNVYLSEDGLTNWFYAGKSISTAGIIDFKVLPSDFPAGSNFFVKVEDVASPTVFDIVEGYIAASLSILTHPVETKLATNFAISGKCDAPDGYELTLRFSSLTGFQEYTIIVNSGEWSIAVAQIDIEHGFLPNQSIDIRIYDDNTYVEIIGAFSSIATITMNTPVLTAGTEGSITGTSNGLVVDVYSRVSSPEGAWELFDGTVAVDESGDWTATGTIADAGTYDFRAVDTTDPDGYVQVDDVVVASGIVLTALQITNATDAVADDIFSNKLLKDGTDTYISLQTKSTKINIKGVDYETGASSTVVKTVVVKTNDAQEILWVKFYDLFFDMFGQLNNNICESGNYLFVLSSTYPLRQVNSTILRINKSDGATVNSLALSKGGYTQAWAVGIGIYDGKLWAVGQVNPSAWAVKTWEMPLDLSTQNLNSISGLAGNFVLSSSITDKFAYCTVGWSAFPQRIDLDTDSYTAGLVNYFQGNTTHIGVNLSGNALMFGNGGTKPAIQRRSTDFVSQTGYIDPYPDVAYSTAYNGSGFYCDGYFYVIRKKLAENKIVVSRIVDDTSNPLTAGDMKELTPNSTSAVYAGFSDIVVTSTRYFIMFAMKGNYESGFTAGDATKYDTILLAVEK